MTCILVQFPEPLCQRLKENAERQDGSLLEAMRKAVEHFVTRSPGESRWNSAARTKTGFREIIDSRLAVTLRHHGDKRFAGFGFERVWSPRTIAS
jgi:hypothetical protein